jgi:hypothetical protein
MLSPQSDADPILRKLALLPTYSIPLRTFCTVSYIRKSNTVRGRRRTSVIIRSACNLKRQPIDWQQESTLVVARAVLDFARQSKTQMTAEDTVVRGAQLRTKQYDGPDRALIRSSRVFAKRSESVVSDVGRGVSALRVHSLVCSTPLCAPGNAANRFAAPSFNERCKAGSQ